MCRLFRDKCCGWLRELRQAFSSKDPGDPGVFGDTTTAIVKTMLVKLHDRACQTTREPLGDDLDPSPSPSLYPQDQCGEADGCQTPQRMFACFHPVRCIKVKQ